MADETNLKLPRRLIVNDENKYVLVCLGITEEELLSAITGGGTKCHFFPEPDFCHCEGYLTDGRMFYVQGQMRDGVMAVVRVDADTERDESC